tara:strand:+ start:1115 stop:3520 length:2406 start_codon:yes stop_codon:yes gene_type:complete
VLQQLERLNTLGSALYIAAHPDDENTQLIAYLANGRHYRTGYLAATRGDGGQNLIGTEIREKLGVIRTQELLAARRTDKGEQYFSRANDFGYSKHPDETFTIWDKDKVLADFVWVIRQFKPDVLITRFSLQPGITHGHHTASAILAMEAFRAAGDPNRYPEQLEFVDVWQPKRIFWNTSSWFFRNSGTTFNPEEYLRVDVGEYNSALGYSYTEISALSRSMHKSQGFGNSGSRGSEFEYFKQWGGDVVSNDLFEGIDTSWDRVKGAEVVKKFLNQALQDYDPREPESILNKLIGARSALLALPDQYWKEVKLMELEQLLLDITGTYLALNAENSSYTPGDSIKVSFEAISRSDVNWELEALRFSSSNERFLNEMSMERNDKLQFNYELVIPENMNYTNPYWLEEEASEGMYGVSDQKLRGLPQNLPAITGYVTLTLGDQVIEVPVPVNYRRTDPVKGEVVTPLIIQPKAMVNLKAKSLIFSHSAPKAVEVVVIAGKEELSGQLSLEVPQGWKVTPEFIDVNLEQKNEEKIVEFLLTPPSGESIGEIYPVIKVEGESYSREKVVIDYDHIPQQNLFQSSSSKVVKLDIKKTNAQIGYVMGAGDEVPEALEGIGYDVTLLDKDDVVADRLNSFDAVLIGVRAFNTLPWLAFKNTELFEFVKQGGNVIVQYNTSHRLVTQDVAPYALTLSRDRVTVENSEVKFLAPKHSVLNYPNKITSEDMDGWVQERGLYFPNKWSEEFIPILGMNDPGEEETKGSLLVAKYGKGYYCYTGLSFFRELPAGVPGAYKLLVNMISLGDNQTNP